MKKIFTLTAAIMIGFGSFAQDANDYLEISRDVLKTEKKAMIAEVMQLTESESPAFWPLYNEFDQKKYDLNTQYLNLIREFADNYGNMSGEVATNLMNGVNKYKMDMLKLEKAYMKKFSKILTAQKTLRYFQAENKIRALIDAELALEIPLLDELNK